MVAPLEQRVGERSVRFEGGSKAVRRLLARGEQEVPSRGAPHIQARSDRGMGRANGAASVAPSPRMVSNPTAYGHVVGFDRDGSVMVQWSGTRAVSGVRPDNLRGAPPGWAGRRQSHGDAPVSGRGARSDGKLYLRPSSLGWYVERGHSDSPTILAGPFSRERANAWLKKHGLQAATRRGLGRFL
jgi:hypothetical protein